MTWLGLFNRTRGDFRRRWGSLIGWQLLLQLLGLVAITPLAGWFADRIVARSGSDVISDFDIARFVLSPAGIVFVLLAAGVAVSFQVSQLRRLRLDFRSRDCAAPGHAAEHHRRRREQAEPACAARRPLLRAHRAARPAVRGHYRARVVHDTRRAGRELLPVREPAGVAPCAAGGGHRRCRLRVRPAGTVRALDLRDADRHVPCAATGRRAARERAHARGTVCCGRLPRCCRGGWD